MFNPYKYTNIQKDVAIIKPNKTERKIKFRNPKELVSSESEEVS
jgi:hypothetical protein